MNKPFGPLKNIVEYALPWLVLAVLLTYTYAKFFQHPYGFHWVATGFIDEVFVKQAGPTLEVGDRLVKVGQISWNTFSGDLYKTFFEGVTPGTVVPVTVERAGQSITIPWRLPGMNRGEFLDELSSEWFLAYIFWFVGTFTLLVIRPKDERWLMLSAFNFISAIWLIAGGGTSSFHIWDSAIVLRMAIWLSIPIYLHLHWVFPHPLGRLSPLLIGVGYLAALGLMLAQAYQLLSPNTYFLGFLVAILGSLVLLIVHAIRQPETRSDLRLILIAFFLGLVPLIAVLAIDSMRGSSPSDALALISLPLIPLVYLYTSYRSQLGGLEIRVNRLISLYIFLILVCTVGLPLLVLLDQILPSPHDVLLIAALAIVLTSIVSTWGFPLFQGFVEHRFLGISLPIKHLSEIYSARLATCNSFTALEKLLKEDILPSLLVKQFVFLQLSGPPRVVLGVGMEQEQILEEQSLAHILSKPGLYPPQTLTDHQATYSWVRLALPLKVGDGLIGLWLFGRRDPDDFYSQSEISLFESLANQTAIALSNILQTERLKAVYQADINRHEQERLSLARDLHDGILNRLASLMMNLDGVNLTPEFNKAYETLTSGLRETVSNLRPPLLDYGLEPALNELAENLMELSQDNVRILVELDPGDNRYDSLIELYVFRIIQEACQNSIRHGQAQKITISGSLESEQINLSVRDDGSGFNAGRGLALNDLIANEHFGLAGMVERAELIGADLKISSQPQKGTVVLFHLPINGSNLS